MLTVPTTKGDKIVIAFTMVAVLSLYAIYWQQSRYGNQASIFIAGKFWASYDLYQDQSIKANGKIGESLLEISNGKIRFVASPCPNKICIHHGWAHHGGELVACVPNEISVRVLGPDSRFDAINF